MSRPSRHNVPSPRMRLASFPLLSDSLVPPFTWRPCGAAAAVAPPKTVSFSDPISLARALSLSCLVSSPRAARRRPAAAAAATARPLPPPPPPPRLAPQDTGSTALHYAARCSDCQAACDVIKLLLDGGAKVKAVDNVGPAAAAAPGGARTARTAPPTTTTTMTTAVSPS